jgi:ferritin-like metal-binding protein YciE
VGESLLRQTLEEEKETDEKLTDLANSINFEAAASEQAVEGKNGRRNAKAART